MQLTNLLTKLQNLNGFEPLMYLDHIHNTHTEFYHDGQLVNPSDIHDKLIQIIDNVDLSAYLNNVELAYIESYTIQFTPTNHTEALFSISEVFRQIYQHLDDDSKKALAGITRYGYINRNKNTFHYKAKDRNEAGDPIPANLLARNLKNFPNLTSLVCNKATTDGMLQGLPLLKVLQASDKITDAGIKILTNLTDLNLLIDDKTKSFTNKKITNDGIKDLTNLTNLNLIHNYIITDEGIQYLVNLENLNLVDNERITDEGIQKLTNLKNLNLQYNQFINDGGIQKLTKLSNLNLADNNAITDKGLKYLHNLTSLNLENNEMITDDVIKFLTNITKLDLTSNWTITNESIKYLTNLRTLYLSMTRIISDVGIKNLTNLTDLVHHANEYLFE